MSQAGIINTQSSPPTPGTVLFLQGNDAVNVGPNGAGVIFTPADDTIANNDNGIVTQNTAANTESILLTNRIAVTGTTVGATTTTVSLFTPSTDIVFRFTATIVGRDTGNGLASGGEILGLGKNVAAVTSIVSSNDAFDDEDSGQGGINWDITTDGTNILASFTGVVARTINWKCLFTYVQVS